MTGASAPSLEEMAWAKQVVRERVWALLEREGWPASRAPRVVTGPRELIHLVGESFIGVQAPA